MPGLWRRIRALAVPPEESPGHRRALRLLGAGVVAAFAAAGASKVDVRRVLEGLAAANGGFLALAMLANVLSLVFHAARWAAVVRPPHVRVRLVDVFEAMVAGFAVGLVVPARAGDLVRSHLLARRAGLSTSAVLAAAVVDYVVGTAALVPLLALLAVATPLPGWARQALLATALASAVGIGALFVLRPRRGHGVVGEGLAGLVARLRSGLSAAHEPAALVRCFGWGLLGWGAEVLIAWFALLAVAVPSGFTVASLAVVATSVANVVAVSPGNAGPFELAAMLPLAGLGVRPEPALTFALLYHAAHLVPIAALGAWIVVREARERA